ncbi:DUF1501 domain-containing protein [Lentisphaerota bacterium WC36G]|nr:DUF1501 domain-containing protein [Lentisphaerae bacterium WC36]
MKDISRRKFLKFGALTAATVSIPPVLKAVVQNNEEKIFFEDAPAKCVIEIWMWGGPSHLDTFDPKPNISRDFNGGLKAIKTNVPEIELSETLPSLAKIADKYSIIRSMTHGINGHETATYVMQTGREPGNGLVYPAIGAVIGMLRGYDYGYNKNIAPYVILTKTKGRFSETGFLSSRYRPFVTGGNPSAAQFDVEGIVSRYVTEQQQLDRKELLNRFNSMNSTKKKNNERSKNYDKTTVEAYSLMLGDVKNTFDLSKESKEMRKKYGMTQFGQSCLVARRLAEKGVKYITINVPGWDTHKRHFEIMKRKLVEFDQGLAALISDLSDKNMLDSTLVWCSGEFGRTPKILWNEPWNGGRGHFGNCFSALVAGGGFKGGCVVGASDSTGENVAKRPVYPEDFLGSIYELAGINPEGIMPNPLGKKLKIMPSMTRSSGRLTEIYCQK